MLAAMASNGLNATLKVSVVGLGAAGACDAAATDAAPARATSTAMTAAVKTFLDIGFHLLLRVFEASVWEAAWMTVI